MNKLLFAIVLATLAVPTTFAGLYDQPYAIVESGDASELRKEARLAISKVNGRSLSQLPRGRKRPDPSRPASTTSRCTSSARATSAAHLWTSDGPPSVHALSHRCELRGQDGGRLETDRLFRVESANASGNSRSETQRALGSSAGVSLSLVVGVLQLRLGRRYFALHSGDARFVLRRQAAASAGKPRLSPGSGSRPSSSFRFATARSRSKVAICPAALRS